MDDHESHKAPDAPIRFEVNRRTVIETGTTAMLLTALTIRVIATRPMTPGMRSMPAGTPCRPPLETWDNMRTPKTTMTTSRTTPGAMEGAPRSKGTRSRSRGRSG